MKNQNPHSETDVQENLVQFRTGEIPAEQWCQRSNQAIDHFIQMACSATKFELDAKDNAMLSALTELKEKLYPINQEA